MELWLHLLSLNLLCNGMNPAHTTLHWPLFKEQIVILSLYLLPLKWYKIPVADFTYSTTFNDVFFTFIGSSAYTFQWNFGMDQPQVLKQIHHIPMLSMVPIPLLWPLLIPVKPAQFIWCRDSIHLRSPLQLHQPAAAIRWPFNLPIHLPMRPVLSGSFKENAGKLQLNKNPTVVYNSPGTFNVLW